MLFQGLFMICPKVLVLAECLPKEINSQKP